MAIRFVCSSKSRFKINFPDLQPYFIEQKFLKIGLIKQNMYGAKLKIYDIERTICDTIRYMNKIDKEIFNQAIQSYIKDETKNITKLMNYAGKFNIKNKINTYIGVWI